MSAFDKVGAALMRPATYTGHARELLSLAGCAARYPLGLVEAGLPVGRTQGATEEAVHSTPVILVHGYGHNRSGWFMLERHLRAVGFTTVVTFNYNPLTHDIPRLAQRLAQRVDVVRAVTGADKVHLVGHSLGGVVLRWYVQELGGDETVDTAITVASPHEGTLAATLAPGDTARQLRPGSWVMRRLAEGARPSDVRWIAFYSNLDLLVQPAPSAMIRDPALRATNILAKDHGHLTIMISQRVAGAVTAQLEAAEGVAGVGTVHGLPVAPDDEVAQGQADHPAAAQG